MDTRLEDDVTNIHPSFLIGSSGESSVRHSKNSTSSRSSLVNCSKETSPSTDITEQRISKNISTISHSESSKPISGTSISNTPSSNQHSWQRNPNFFKIDDRIKRVDSDLRLATKAKESRYCIKHSKSQKHLDEYYDPYYYYSMSINSSTATIVSPVRTPSQTPVVDSFSDQIMTQEELENLDDQFEKDINPFKTKLDYFKPQIYFKHYRFGQCLVVGLLMSIVIFGSFGYLITVARSAYKRPPPEVYEILSPYKYPHLAAIRTNLIDPDTPQQAFTKPSFITNDTWELVFSDEFNAEGRTFFPGDDQFFEAVDIHYASTNDLEYYLPEMVTTSNGSLKLKIDAFPTNGLLYRSGMLQSWNKMCYSDKAIVEVGAKFPGYSQENGLWPAIWSLGNLARPGYQATTDGVWPYTYDVCDSGIAPNQSSIDGISYLPGQKLSKCVCYGEDHPNVGVGRGAPEIDIIEGFHNPNDKTFLGMQTLQVAPFDPWYMPDYDYISIHDSNITSMKSETGTQTQEAIAAGTIINETWFNEVHDSYNISQAIEHPTYFQSYGFEYNSDKTVFQDSYLQFFIGNDPTVGIRGDALHSRYNIGSRQITKEPMSMVFNLGLSETWSTIDYGTLQFPGYFEIDYIRIYQPKGETSMTCDPHGYPTTQYIQDHFPAYSNANFTSWEQAGYTKPRNSLMNNCEVPYGVGRKV